MTELLAAVAIFSAILVQSVAGFGAGLTAMPILITLLGHSVAAPLFALLGPIGGVMMLLRYRTALSFKAVWRLIAASWIGIPLGIMGSRLVDERLVMIILGGVLVIYALYMLGGFMSPPLKHPRWAWSLGLLSGLLSGAYNTGGPPLIIYGTSQRWQPDQFKGNVQAMFFGGGLVTISTHILTGHVTSEVLHYFVWLAPILIVTYLIGFSLDRLIHPQLFRKLVLILLVILGLTLIF